MSFEYIHSPFEPLWKRYSEPSPSRNTLPLRSISATMNTVRVLVIRMMARSMPLDAAPESNTGFPATSPRVPYLISLTLPDFAAYGKK